MLLGSGRRTEALEMLRQCQLYTLKAGEWIEESEGMGTEAVACLEEYCDQLYQMSQWEESSEGEKDGKGAKPENSKKAASREKVENGEKTERSERGDKAENGQKTIEALKKQLDKTLKRAEGLLKMFPADKLKVVFMPYKASMWDCMESVWEAAAADENCQAFVVPIPFYERNPEGMVEKACYEGEMFPAYVPIVHYRQFFLEQEEPDIIYIHNPFDNTNNVTTIHPDYYSDNLKKYTDMLVYIPYFFMGNGPLPEIHRDLAGYRHVDKIILQNREQLASLSEEYAREKAVVLGSPKIDRLLKLAGRREEIIGKEIPAEWRKKIAGKKVVLFNISVTGILHHSNCVTDKIRYVLSCFKDREDVVLWWRPHPLIEGTLKAIRPQLYEEYMQIKDEFVREGWGILDESGDAGVAAVVADAYLGEDSSSLAHYFGVLGKAVMFTEWEIVEDTVGKSRDFLWFHTFFQEGDKLYFVPAKVGYGHELFCVDVEKGIVEKILTFPGSAENIWAAYRGIKKIQNKIILVPYNTEDVYIYDREKGQAVKVVLPQIENREAESQVMRFGGIEEYNGNIYLLPVCYPALIKIDLDNLEVVEYKECIASFASEDKEKILFLWGYYRKDHYLYLATCGRSEMLIFDMENNSFIYKKIGDYKHGYGHMIFDGKYFWLSTYGENSIVRWDEQSEEAKKYSYPIEQQEKLSENHWASILDNGENIIVCCGTSVDIVALNKKTGKPYQTNGMKGILSRVKEESINYHFSFGWMQGRGMETALIYSMGNSMIYVWNMNTDRWKSVPCRLPQNEMLKMERKSIEKYGISRSTPFCLWENMVTILQFIEYIAKGNTKIFKNAYECYHNDQNGDSIGSQIYNYIKGKTNV